MYDKRLNLPNNREGTTQMNSINGKVKSGSAISIGNDVTKITSVSVLAFSTTVSVVEGIIMSTKRSTS